MADLIGKFTKDGTSYYFDYSTVTGVPSTALELPAYRERYVKLHGRIGLAKLAGRLERVDAKGTSSHHKKNLDEMLKGNRAGEGGKELSTAEVIDLLVVQRVSAHSQRT